VIRLWKEDELLGTSGDHYSEVASSTLVIVAPRVWLAPNALYPLAEGRGLLDVFGRVRVSVEEDPALQDCQFIFGRLELFKHGDPVLSEVVLVSPKLGELSLRHAISIGAGIVRKVRK
jgi:hypothetical protein